MKAYIKALSLILLNPDVGYIQINSFFNRYDIFMDMAREGELGATAAYWMLYIDMVDVWLLLSQTCRSCDVDLFVISLSLMVPFFFACNKHNYARWMTRFVLQLTNIDKTHPGLQEILQNGALSVRRSPNNFT